VHDANLHGRRPGVKFPAILYTGWITAATYNKTGSGQPREKLVEENKVDMFMMINSNNLPSMSLPSIRQQLLALPDARAGQLHSMQFKSPTTAIIISVLIGSLGIDRFYIGDTGLGIAKLLTCGGVGIWTIVDWFLIMGLARQRNYDKLVATIA
jgi:TM2 domain-containing membrane protein YozV